MVRTSLQLNAFHKIIKVVLQGALFALYLDNVQGSECFVTQLNLAVSTISKDSVTLGKGPLPFSSSDINALKELVREYEAIQNSSGYSFPRNDYEKNIVELAETSKSVASTLNDLVSIRPKTKADERTKREYTTLLRDELDRVIELLKFIGSKLAQRSPSSSSSAEITDLETHLKTSLFPYVENLPELEKQTKSSPNIRLPFLQKLKFAVDHNVTHPDIRALSTGNYPPNLRILEHTKSFRLAFTFERGRESGNLKIKIILVGSHERFYENLKTKLGMR